MKYCQTQGLLRMKGNRQGRTRMPSFKKAIPRGVDIEREVRKFGVSGVERPAAFLISGSRDAFSQTGARGPQWRVRSISSGMQRGTGRRERGRVKGGEKQKGNNHDHQFRGKKNKKVLRVTDDIPEGRGGGSSCTLVEDRSGCRCRDWWYQIKLAR